MGNRRLLEPFQRYCIFIILIILMAQTKLAKMQPVTGTDGSDNSEFAMKLIQHLTKTQPQGNIILSPASIQICSAMLRVGARGETALQLDRGLSLQFNGDINEIANYFFNILSSYEGAESPLSIANKIYVMSGYEIRESFNEIVRNKFLSTIENIDFADNNKAANSMNNWVETKTNSKIKNLISPNVIDDETRLVLLNAIHFKGEWRHKFSPDATQEADFYLNDADSVKVQMMSQRNRFKYAELNDLDAKVLEMPYRNTDLSMMIILPNTRTGLKSLEEKMLNVKLGDISNRLEEFQVNVKLPKFKDEFSIDLSDAFQKMGMSKMFSNGAELTGMLDSSEALRVSKIVHKAFIEVDESGTEAAAATVVAIRKKRSMQQINEFIVEHPFLYCIHQNINHDDMSTPLFMGHIFQLSNLEHITHDEF